MNIEDSQTLDFMPGSQLERGSASQSPVVMERTTPTGSQRHKRRRSTEIMDLIERELTSAGATDPVDEEIDGFLTTIKSHLRLLDARKRLAFQSKVICLLAETFEQ